MQTDKAQLKQIFTSYWHFLALFQACKLNLFEFIKDNTVSLQDISVQLSIKNQPLFHLIEFLIEEGYLVKCNQKHFLTSKGELLTENHPESLKNACLLWGQEHLNAWQHLDFTLKTGKPSFEKLYEKPFFKYLQKNPKKLRNYHLAMRDYAKDDYAEICSVIDFSNHRNLADVGGGVGTVTSLIKESNPNIDCILFDLPEVVELIDRASISKFTVFSGSFFEPLPFTTNAILLSRVLHDWNDNDAKAILKNCCQALSKEGTIYIIEILQNETTAHLLSLNMLAMCESYERTLDEYQGLLQAINFEIIETKLLNSLQKIMICQSRIQK